MGSFLEKGRLAEGKLVEGSLLEKGKLVEGRVVEGSQLQSPGGGSLLEGDSRAGAGTGEGSRSGAGLGILQSKGVEVPV